jgi:hypothetical protein
MSRLRSIFQSSEDSIHAAQAGYDYWKFGIARGVGFDSVGRKSYGNLWNSVYNTAMWYTEKKKKEHRLGN